MNPCLDWRWRSGKVKGEVRRANANSRPALLTNPALPSSSWYEQEREAEQCLCTLESALDYRLFFFSHGYFMGLYPKLGNWPWGWHWLNCFGDYSRLEGGSFFCTQLSSSARSPVGTPFGRQRVLCWQPPSLYRLVVFNHSQVSCKFRKDFFLCVWFAAQCKPYTGWQMFAS